MALPRIVIELQNGRLGLVAQTTDNVVGLIAQGIAASGIALNTPTLITSLTDAESKGITQSYDTTNSVKVWQHVKEFYEEAGSGAELWLMLRAQADTYVQMLNAGVLATLVTGSNDRVKVVGIARNPASGYTPTVTGMDTDVTAALTVAQAKATELAEAFTPVRVILQAHALTTAHAALPDLKTYSTNRVGVLAGGTASGINSIGQLLGRIAKIPVQRKIARVKDGALVASTAFVGTSTVDALGETAIAVMHDKGYITLRKIKRKSGYYYTFDPMAVASSDDYSTLTNGRVIDKAITLTYDTYVNELNDEILVDDAGKIDPSTAKYYQSQIENAVNQSMTANNEISAFRADIDPNQNVVSAQKFYADLYLTPVGYSKEIRVRLGFEL